MHFTELLNFTCTIFMNLSVNISLSNTIHSNFKVGSFMIIIRCIGRNTTIVIFILNVCTIRKISNDLSIHCHSFLKIWFKIFKPMFPYINFIESFTSFWVDIVVLNNTTRTPDIVILGIWSDISITRQCSTKLFIQPRDDLIPFLTRMLTQYSCSNQWSTMPLACDTY